MARCAHPSTIDIAAIIIDDPYKAGNCKKCRMTNGRAPIIIQTPVVHLPFVFRPGEDTSVSGAIDMQPDPVRRKYAEDFIDLLTRIDSLVKSKAVENSVVWLGAPKSAEVIDSLYKPVLRESEKYAPNFKMKFLTKDDGSPDFDVYDEDMAPVTKPLVDVFAKNSRFTAIVECTGVWLAGGNCGYNWRIKQIKMYHNVEQIMFLDDAVIGAAAVEEETVTFIDEHEAPHAIAVRE